jgi:hypothetical protein
MILTAALFLAAAPQGWFPFVIPWDDATPSVTNLSYLNTIPAGKNGQIVARNSHFFEAASGKRIRFLAVNMVAAAAFPSHADAEKTAAHLAKMGVNLVRFHHLQNSWGVDTGGSIWKKGRLYLDLDPVQLDKLDYLFAALKKHGIYSNINLQTTRKYLPEMGFPNSVVDIPFELDKRIDKVDRRMIRLQKQYARDLLDRKNPYTGLPYRDDPALAFVEINNENSLVGWPGESLADAFGSLPDAFRDEIVLGWNQWLSKRYGSDAAVKAAWSKGQGKLGPSILPIGVEWSTENQSNGDVKFESPNPNKTVPSKPGEARTIRATVNSNVGPDWHVQMHLTGLNFSAGSDYTLRFRARCSQKSTITASAVLDESDWHSIGLSQPITIEPEWRNYSISFSATDTKANHNRIGFAIGAMRGVLEIEALSVCSGVDAGPLLGGSLAKQSIPIPVNGIRARSQDFYRYLTETETAFSDEMRAFVRKDLGIKANLVDTQVAWGGLSSLVRERGSDYADNHSYWQHPSFPGTPWDSANWLISNTPMVDAMVKQTDSLSDLARFRFADKPYTVSEYNHPAPSDFRVEMMPLLSTMAALQDWDAFYLFEYGVYGAGQRNDQMTGYFDVGADPMRGGFFQSAALIFRAGLVNPLSSVDLAVVPPAVAELAVGSAWAGRSVNPLTHRLAVSSHGISQVVEHGGGPANLSQGPNGPIFTLQEPNAAVVVGHVADQKIHLDMAGHLALTLGFGEFGRGFAAATCTSLRGGGYLLTIGSRAENQGITWNAARTTIGADWGHGPVLAEGVPCDLSVIGGFKNLHIWALDPKGKRKAQLTVLHDTNSFSARLSPSDGTIWYEIAE